MFPNRWLLPHQKRPGAACPTPAGTFCNQNRRVCGRYGYPNWGYSSLLRFSGCMWKREGMPRLTASAPSPRHPHGATPRNWRLGSPDPLTIGHFRRPVIGWWPLIAPHSRARYGDALAFLRISPSLARCRCTSCKPRPHKPRPLGSWRFEASTTLLGWVWLEKRFGTRGYSRRPHIPRLAMLSWNHRDQILVFIFYSASVFYQLEALDEYTIDAGILTT